MKTADALSIALGIENEPDPVIVAEKEAEKQALKDAGALIDDEEEENVIDVDSETVVDDESTSNTSLIVASTIDKSEVELKADYNLSRKTFRSLIVKGEQAIDDMTDLARDSESSRAYEVLATLIKTVGDTTDKLLDLQKKKKEIHKLEGNRHPDGSTGGNTYVDKAVFVGSPRDMLKRLKNKDV